MNVVTYIYEDFANEVSSTHKFRESAARFGYDVLNVAQEKRHVGNAAVLRLLYDAYKQLSGPVIYADGADTFFFREVVVPKNMILYSTEKAIWPPTQELKGAWAKYYKNARPCSPWAYLNGGAYCGPAELLAEFFKRYVLSKIDGMIDEAHAQGIQALAFIQALEDHFPIMLDDRCEQFQSIAFQEPGDFHTNKYGFIVNDITKTKPALIHGNGRTPMGWVYDLVK